MSIYDLTFNDAKGQLVKMSDYRGKVLLIVNTATKCGFAPQFEALETLNKKYKDKNFAVIGFPSNQFMNQEPETDETMESVCKINFGVTFTLSKKIDVNGKNTHPVFAYLKNALRSGFLGRNIKWNFTKFLITTDGTPYKRYAPVVNPADIEADIIKLLNGSNT